jgi:uncharacterized protein (TIGR02246 family)
VSASDLDTRLDRLESIEAIRQLLATYSHGFDGRDLERFLGVFHEDAVWSPGPDMEFSGTEAIRAATEGMWGALSETHHWAANVLIDVDGDTGTGTNDVDVVLRTADGLWMQAAATYHDTYERRDGVWAIWKRTTTMHFQRPMTPDSMPEEAS